MEDTDENYEYSATGFPVSRPVQVFSISFRQPGIIRLVNVDQTIATCVQERLEQLLPITKCGYLCFSDYQTGFTGRFNIFDLVLEKPFFTGDGSVGKEDATLVRVALCRVLGALYCIGYDVAICSDVTRTRTNGTIFMKLRDPTFDLVAVHYYSHKFVCVAPYSTDTLLLINIPKVMLERVIKVIHLTWSPGVKSKQTLADDNRSVSVITSLKIHGNPWSQAVYNSGKASCQARLVMLEIIKIFAANNWRLAANVNLESTADTLVFQWCPNLDMEEFRFCAVSLNRYDRLRLVRTPGILVGAIKEAVIKHWYLGLQKQRDYHGTAELKLGGCPWWADSNDAVESRYFVSTLIGILKVNGWQVAGTMDLTRRNNDKSTLVLRQSVAKMQPHMCISLNKTNRIRLIVSSTDISEEAELKLTSKLNQTIKNYWVALGPRNYGKSIEWKLEGDPWASEGLYSDSTRGIYLLCLILQAVSPLGWRVTASADVSAKNLDANDRYSYEGQSEDMHSWFFLYDEKVAQRNEERSTPPTLASKDLCSSSSVPNLEFEQSEENLYYGDMPTRPVSSSLQQVNPELSRSVPGIPAATAAAAANQDARNHAHATPVWGGLRNCSRRPPGLGNLPRQKSLDSSLAAAHLVNQPIHSQGSVSNLYNNQYLSNSSFTTFRNTERQCYASRHGVDRHTHQVSDNSHNKKIDGYKSDGYKSDGYKSDGYKSDGDGYKSDGEHVKRRTRYSSPAKQQLSKYEQDRLTSRRLQSNGDAGKTHHHSHRQAHHQSQHHHQQQMQSGDECIGVGSGGGGLGGIGGANLGPRVAEFNPSRCSSRGGYRSDPEQEIEIQLKCIAAHDDSGESQHSHRGFDEEDEMVKVESSWGGCGGGRQDKVVSRSQEMLDSRSHSRNGYKSDGSHGSLHDSPLRPTLGSKCEMGHLQSGYGGGGSGGGSGGSSNGGRGMRRGLMPGGMQSHSSSHLNSPYSMQAQRVLMHPSKHLEASRSFHTFQRQESTTSFHSTHSAPNPPPPHHNHNQNLMVNNMESASQASTHSHSQASTHSSSSSASVGPPEYNTVIHPPPSYDQALIKLDIAMRRRAANKNRYGGPGGPQQQHKGTTNNSLHYVGEFYG